MLAIRSARMGLISVPQILDCGAWITCRLAETGFVWVIEEAGDEREAGGKLADWEAFISCSRHEIMRCKAYRNMILW